MGQYGKTLDIVDDIVLDLRTKKVVWAHPVVADLMNLLDMIFSVLFENLAWYKHNTHEGFSDPSVIVYFSSRQLEFCRGAPANLTGYLRPDSLLSYASIACSP